MSDPVWDTKRKRRRSALKSPPLRLPGQSDDERMSELKDKFGVLLVIPLCFVVLALFEWVRWWTAAQPNPYVPTVSALIAILYAWRKGVPLLANIKNLRLGRDGERAVGQMLEQLRGTGYQVFHDIPGDGLNIAHVIVGPADVFTIETKTRSKPTRGGSSILYDGETVRIGNGVPTHEPLSQARAQARCLAHLLNDCRSSKLIVRPVVVFPEWYVERISDWRKGGLWVLNPKELDDFLDYESEILTAEQIDSVVNILALHCRQLAA